MSEDKRPTRLVRLDMDIKGSVQLEVPLADSVQKAKEAALKTINDAIRRGEKDSAVKLVRNGGEQFFDPTGTKREKEGAQ